MPSSHSTTRMIAIVSSIRRLHSSGIPKCNLGAVLCRTWRMLILAFSLTLLPFAAEAQEGATTPAQAKGSQAADTVKFLAGSALAFAMHEAGHLAFDAAFDAQARVKGVSFGPFPFFAIVHRPDLSPHREFAVSSAGFWVQNGTNEWLLTRRPAIRQDHAPWAKGMIAFNVVTS